MANDEASKYACSIIHDHLKTQCREGALVKVSIEGKFLRVVYTDVGTGDNLAKDTYRITIKGSLHGFVEDFLAGGFETPYGYSAKHAKVCMEVLEPFFLRGTMPGTSVSVSYRDKAKADAEPDYYIVVLFVNGDSKARRNIKVVHADPKAEAERIMKIGGSLIPEGFRSNASATTTTGKTKH